MRHSLPWAHIPWISLIQPVILFIPLFRLEDHISIRIGCNTEVRPSVFGHHVILTLLFKLRSVYAVNFYSIFNLHLTPQDCTFIHSFTSPVNRLGSHSFLLLFQSYMYAF